MNFVAGFYAHVSDRTLSSVLRLLHEVLGLQRRRLGIELRGRQTETGLLLHDTGGLQKRMGCGNHTRTRHPLQRSE